MKKWQCIEVMAVAPAGATEVELVTFHAHLAEMLNQFGIGAGEWIVPLPNKVLLPAEHSKTSMRQSFMFYILVYAEPIERWSWQIE